MSQLRVEIVVHRGNVAFVGTTSVSDALFLGPGSDANDPELRKVADAFTSAYEKAVGRPVWRR